MKNITNTRRKVTILAYQIARNNPTQTTAQNMRQAWAKVKAENEFLHILEATKTNGEKMTRVVYTNWSAYNEVKGTGRQAPAGLILLVDVAKHMSDLRSTISVYESNIQTLAA